MWILHFYVYTHSCGYCIFMFIRTHVDTAYLCLHALDGAPVKLPLETNVQHICVPDINILDTHVPDINNVPHGAHYVRDTCVPDITAPEINVLHTM